MRVITSSLLALAVASTVFGAASAQHIDHFSQVPPIEEQTSPVDQTPTYTPDSHDFFQHQLQPNLSNFEMGLRLWHAQRYREAIPYLQAACKDDPKNAKAWYLLAVAQLQLKEYGKSIQSFDHAIKLEPSKSDSFANRGFAKESTGDIRGALSDYTQALSLNKNPGAFLLYKSGLLSFQTGDSQKAANYLTETLKKDPSQSQALWYRALAYCKLSQFEKAMDDLNQYIRATGGDEQSFIKRGDLYFAQGQNSRATHDYSEGLRLNPDATTVRENRSIAYSRLRQFSDALRDANELIKDKPNLARAYSVRAFAQFEAGDMRGARGDCDFCASLAKEQKVHEDYLEQYVRGGILMREKDAKGALVYFSRSIELNPSFAEAYCDAGVAHCNLSDYASAIQEFRKATELAPELSASHNNLGFAELKQGDCKAAIDEFDKALKLNPKFSQAYTNRGNAYLKLNDIEHAVKDCTEAVQLNPSSAFAHLSLSQALAKQGNAERAGVEFSEAKKLDPSSATSAKNN